MHTDNVSLKERLSVSSLTGPQFMTYFSQALAERLEMWLRPCIADCAQTKGSTEPMISLTMIKHLIKHPQTWQTGTSIYLKDSLFVIKHPWQQSAQ